MGNIAYITTRQHVTSIPWGGLLATINEQRFGGLLTIKRVGGFYDNWFEVHFGDRYLWDMGPYSTRKWGSKHPNGPEWVYWMWIVFRNEIGARTDGRMGDEGDNDHWDPEPNKYPTARDWFEARIAHMPPETREPYIEQVWPLHTEGLPDELRTIVLGEEP